MASVSHSGVLRQTAPAGGAQLSLFQGKRLPLKEELSPTEQEGGSGGKLESLDAGLPLVACCGHRTQMGVVRTPTVVAHLYGKDSPPQG